MLIWLSAIITKPEPPSVPCANLSSHLTTYGKVIFVMPILSGSLFRISYTKVTDESFLLLHPDASIVTCNPNSLILIFENLRVFGNLKFFTGMKNLFFILFIYFLIPSSQKWQ